MDPPPRHPTRERVVMPALFPAFVRNWGNQSSDSLAAEASTTPRQSNVALLSRSLTDGEVAAPSSGPSGP